MLIDTHAHLNFRKQTEEFDGRIAFDQFDNEIDEVIARANQNDVDKMIIVGDTIEDSQRGIDLVADRHNLWATVGIHPHAIIEDKFDQHMAALEGMILSSTKVVAIGEIGLDYSRTDDNKDVQQKFFIAQLELARRHNLPVIIHARDAYQDIFTIISDAAWKDLRTVIHCYTDTVQTIEPFLQHGSYVSFTGIVTFPSAHIVKESARHIPIERMMIETDSPFLAPQAVRGKRNEPAYLKYIAQEIADLKALSYEEVATKTTLNASHFFNLPL
jgi:TatD DNase family protein